jgi:hypothetical protein
MAANRARPGVVHLWPLRAHPQGQRVLGTLPGCGGSVDAAPGALDPIWGTVGLATQIINSLQGITQSMFPGVDFTATSYGAQQCSVVAATNPYTGTTSPTSPGANQTSATGAFDSRPAFLAAIQACNAAAGSWSRRATGIAQGPSCS